MSYQKKTIKIDDLLVNPKNFRFEPVTSQKEAINTMINKMKRKIKNIAEDIAKHGLNPTEFVSVTKTDKEKYLVHEGNRRLTAIKLIDNPRIIQLDEKTKQFFEKLKTDYQENLPSKIECVVFPQEKDTYHWIKLKHTGENKGVGVTHWNNKEQGRFESHVTNSKPKHHIQVQYFMQNNSILFPENHSTTLQRLISNPYIREKIGIYFEDGDLRCRNKKVVIDNLKKISSAMQAPGFNVRKLESKNDRKRWINKILKPPKSPKKIQLRREGEIIKESLIRTKLIPGDFTLTISHNKINFIYKELKELNVDEYGNAVAVLFRVFLELSVKNFIDIKKKDGYDLLQDLTEREKNKKEKEQKIPLSTKIKIVAKYMEKEKILTKDILQPVRIAIQDKYHICSTHTFNSYVHNLNHVPLGNDLKRSWDNLQKFIEKLWE